MEQLELKDFQDFVNNHLVLYSRQEISRKNIKELYVNLRGGFEIWHNGEKVRECMQPFVAIEFYNDLN